MGNWSDYILKLFQSTLPRRERPNANLTLFFLLFYFNPHSHEGSDDTGKYNHNVVLKFQSTLPRRERLLVTEYKFARNGISIHTPTKGATPNGSLSLLVTPISIHTPTKGATLLPDQTDQSKISIHTPTKGATIKIRKKDAETRISIHTPTKGATSVTYLFYTYFCEFQSTLPRRERQRRDGPDNNPRVISIHTPTKGATAILTNNFLIFCSISLINFILYLQIIQILFIVRYKFIFYFIF